METFPSKLVTDTNIWIDLHNGGILEAAFKLPCRFLVTEIILASEFLTPPAIRLLSLGLVSKKLRPAQIRELEALVQRYRRPSFNDLTALILAKSLDVPLLTGDKHLREAAQNEGVTIRGVLYLLDAMVEHKTVNPPEASNALSAMLESGSRLPKQECQKRLILWKQ